MAARSSIAQSLFSGLPKTYPQPLGSYKKLITSQDVVKDFGNLKLLRARPEHSPIMKNSVRDMFRNEVTTHACGASGMPEKVLDSLVYNLCRYPVSYFAVNSSDEVVSIACSNIIYKDNFQDPLPRKDANCSDPTEPFQALMGLIDWAEQRHLQRLGVEKLVHHELAFTPTVLRGQRVSSTIYPTVFQDVIVTSLRMGLKYNVGMVTCNANLKNMLKLHYRAVETIPKELYKKIDGSPMEMPEEEGPAVLIEMDMEEMNRKGTFNQH